MGAFKLVINDKETAFNGQNQEVKTKALEMNAGFHNIA